MDGNTMPYSARLLGPNKLLRLSAASERLKSFCHKVEELARGEIADEKLPPTVCCWNAFRNIENRDIRDRFGHLSDRGKGNIAWMIEFVMNEIVNKYF